jgi:putative radical SAM enzyme (TIGR03279 family)
MPKLYGWIHEIVPDSPADLAGLQPGDALRTINGRFIRDVVDYRFYQADEELLIEVDRQGKPVLLRVSKDPDEDMGIIFGEEPAPFIRQCANKCVFCFIKGLPERHEPQRGLPLGMRDSLYIKDDDYRYSFLFGNFITLTNLKEQDWQRLEEQRLSPLYVSVHTTNPELRRKMVDGPRAGDIIGHIERLGRIGITAHAQLVLCPEMNDGAELDRSLRDLAELRPIIETVAVVPVGLTKFNNLIKTDGLPVLRTYRREEAEAVVRQVQRWQRQFAAQDGDPFVFLSDEFYVLTGRKFPGARHYGAFPQIDNGVGMTRHLLDHWSRQRRRLPSSLPMPRKITIFTGTMAAPILAGIAAGLRHVAGLSVEVVPVANGFFGELVTVAGLLTGQDLLDAILAHPDPGDRILIPRVALDDPGERFLDDITWQDFQRRAPAPVLALRAADELVAVTHELISGGSSSPSPPQWRGGRG